MKIQKSFKLALNILLHSKLRSWLTIIGIVIGVAAMVAIVSIGEGAQANVQARLGGLGADLITISPGFERAQGGFVGDRGGGTSTNTAKNITQKDVMIIKTVPGIGFVNPIVSGRVDVSYLAETASLSIQGVDPFAYKNIETAELESGRFLEPSDTGAIMIGYRISTTTFKQPLALNRAITIAGKSYKIVGIFQSSGSGADNRIIMTTEDARIALDRLGQDKFDSIIIKASDVDSVDQVVNDTDLKLSISRHVAGKKKDYTITSAKAMQANIASVTQTFTIFLAAIAAVALLVGAVGIANTMFTSVLEKTKEIGIMKAIGAQNSDIMIIFLMNSGLVGLTGGLIGIGLGAAISSVLPNLLNGLGGGAIRGGLTTLIPISLLVESIVGSVLIGMIAGAIPAYRASKLKPVDALRYE
jgi:putative ABC transport system permease protein